MSTRQSLQAALGRLTISLLVLSTQLVVAQNKGSELKSIDELLALQKAAQAELAGTDKIKKWGQAISDPVSLHPEYVLFRDEFSDLSNWHHEGIGKLTQPEPNVMQLNCVGSGQGSKGCMAFSTTNFPDSIIIEYDLRVLTTNGLFITFIASQGRRGEDMFEELPAREGNFKDYVANPDLRSYHVSVSRYNDEGKHTGVSNWRRNPGLFLMAEQPDLCKEPGTWYHIKIIKQGGLLQMAVDGKFAGGFKDLGQIPEEMPKAGKIGFRAIGKKVIAQVKNFKVAAVKPETE